MFFIVFPEGDHDLNSIMIEATTPKEAAERYFCDGNVGPWQHEVDIEDKVCVVPCSTIKTYVMGATELKMEEFKDE